MRIYAGEAFLLLLFLFSDKIPLPSGKIILLSLAFFKQEADYPSETAGYPLDNSRQTNNTSLFDNGTVLILDEQFA